MKRGFKANAEKTSAKYRSELGLKPYEPLPARTLAQHLGIKIYTPNEVPGLEDHYIQALCKPEKSSWSALTICLNDNSHLIYHNPTNSIPRQESDLMHELAHVICGHKRSALSSLGTFQLMIRDFDKDQEDEANWLGGCLQIPKKGLSWAIFKYKMPSSEIAKYYTASTEMVNFRINMCGLRKKVNELRL